MFEETRTSILYAVVFLFPQVIILIACIFYLAKKVTIDGVLLLIGTLGTFALIIFNQLILPRMLQDAQYAFENQTLFIVTGGVSFLCGLTFAIGFLLLILKKIKK